MVCTSKLQTVASKAILYDYRKTSEKSLVYSLRTRNMVREITGMHVTAIDKKEIAQFMRMLAERLQSHLEKHLCGFQQLFYGLSASETASSDSDTMQIQWIQWIQEVFAKYLD